MRGVLKTIVLVVFLAGATWAACDTAHAADLCRQYQRSVTREAQAVMGIGAPVPLLLAQMRQESSCRADVTAWDNGRGLAQFMDATAQHVANVYPEIGKPDPYNPTWAIRALVRYDDWLGRRVQAISPCDRWGAVLASYNGGLGYVQQSQRASPAPGSWWGITEHFPSRQSPANFAAARSYPRRIIQNHQPIYRDAGVYTCEKL